jgi:hypothetical protein
MLNTTYYAKSMHGVIAALNHGKLIEAIKIFREIYGVGLKEAKDACEAIRDALGLRPVHAGETPSNHYMVVSRHNEHDWDYCVTHCDSRNDATGVAASVCNERHETYVVKVVAKSVTTRSMKEVA